MTARTDKADSAASSWVMKPVPILVCAGLIVSTVLLAGSINSTRISEASADNAAAAESDSRTTTVLLPVGKLQSGQLESAPISTRTVQQLHTIPGRLRYDATKHVAIKAPVDGVLSELRVTPGDHVEAGQVLALLHSTQIGQARADVLTRLQQLKIASMVLQREQVIRSNQQQLMEMLHSNKKTIEIEKEFADEVLGRCREAILSSWSRLELARGLVEEARPLIKTGSLPVRVMLERESERQQAEAAFRAACDEAQFSSEQAVLQASATTSAAEREVDLAWEALDVLMGYQVERTETLWDHEALATLQMRAPFSGSIEICHFARNERLSQGDDLLILANTDTLYVEASIREGDWSAVALKPGTVVSVRISALADQEFSARVHYVGREVDLQTNSIPLVATVDNAAGLLRPGMFVRVTVPIGAARDALTIAPESILQHESQHFVFVDLQNGRYERVNIATGQNAEQWVEVTSGLTQGQQVVTRGAFLLKSELLLQGED